LLNASLQKLIDIFDGINYGNYLEL